MTKHRGFKLDKFLKALDPQLRNQYLTTKGITFSTTINFDDGSFDTIWDGINEAKRVEVEEELHCINDTADHARDCLERAVREFNIQKQENETSETTAMRVFLHSDEAFSLAFDYYLYYSVLSEKLSRHKYPTVTLDFTDTRLAEFKAAVEAYYRDEGKSHHCAIRQRIDDGKHVLLVARGDFMKTHLVFDETLGKPDVRSFRPAREDVLIYDAQKNILCLSVDSRTQDKEKYIEMFGKSFLGLDHIDPSTFDNSLVDLSPIKNQTFSYQGNDKIESVMLSEVDAKHRGGSLRVSLRSTNLAGMQAYGLGAEGAEYVSAKLKFVVKREGRKGKQISVLIKPPENSKIPEKKEKQIIEDYLREQGVILE